MIKNFIAKYLEFNFRHQLNISSCLILNVLSHTVHSFSVSMNNLVVLIFSTYRPMYNSSYPTFLELEEPLKARMTGLLTNLMKSLKIQSIKYLQLPLELMRIKADLQQNQVRWICLSATSSAGPVHFNRYFLPTYFGKNAAAYFKKT